MSADRIPIAKTNEF